MQGAAAEGGRWRKERAHLRLKWPPSSTYLIPSPTDLQQCSCSFHPWMNWVESTACWKVDGDSFSHTQQKKKSPHIHWCFLETSVSVEFWGGCIIIIFSSALVAASVWRMWTECIPFSLSPLWATLSHHYRSACSLWNALLGFGMQMLCSGGGGISEESESDEFLINELWNGSPGAIKDELLSISPSSPSLSLSLKRTQTYP